MVRDCSQSADKKFTINLVDVGKKRDQLKEVGGKYTFMMEQFSDGKILNKDLIIYPAEQS